MEDSKHLQIIWIAHLYSEKKTKQKRDFWLSGRLFLRQSITFVDQDSKKSNLIILLKEKQTKTSKVAQNATTLHHSQGNKTLAWRSLFITSIFDLIFQNSTWT